MEGLQSFLALAVNRSGSDRGSTAEYQPPQLSHTALCLINKPPKSLGIVATTQQSQDFGRLRVAPDSVSETDWQVGFAIRLFEGRNEQIPPQRCKC